MHTILAQDLGLITTACASYSSAIIYIHSHTNTPHTHTHTHTASLKESIDIWFYASIKGKIEQTKNVSWYVNYTKWN